MHLLSKWTCVRAVAHTHLCCDDWPLFWNSPWGGRMGLLTQGCGSTACTTERWGQDSSIDLLKVWQTGQSDGKIKVIYRKPDKPQ